MADHRYHQGCSIRFFLQSSLILHQQVKWGHSPLTFCFNWDFAKEEWLPRAFFSAQRRPPYSHITICSAYRQCLSSPGPGSPKDIPCRLSYVIACAEQGLSTLSGTNSISSRRFHFNSQYAMDSGLSPFWPYFLELTWGKESIYT